MCPVRFETEAGDIAGYMSAESELHTVTEDGEQVVIIPDDVGFLAYFEDGDRVSYRRGDPILDRLELIRGITAHAVLETDVDTSRPFPYDLAIDDRPNTLPSP